MPPYTLPHHLLDRAQIHDTITKLYLLTDLRLWPRLLSSEVFTPHFTLDYTSLFGGSPNTSTTPADAVESFRNVMERMSASTHVQTSLLIEGLPLPSSPGDEREVEIPDHAKVTSYVTVHLVQKGAEGGDSTSNGGICEIEVVRLKTEECRGLYGEGWDCNPWRISLFRPDVRWMEGNSEGILGVKI